MDDYLLLSSCGCLVAATGLVYHGTPSIFFVAELSLNPTAILAGGVSQTEILQRIVLFQRINYSYITISWMGIFLVKFGFLAFFRHLVDRIAVLYRFWKGVIVFTGVVFAFCVCDSFIACSKMGFAARK